MNADYLRTHGVGPGLVERLSRHDTVFLVDKIKDEDSPALFVEALYVPALLKNIMKYYGLSRVEAWSAVFTVLSAEAEKG
jgi:hypothetical protein